MGQTNKSFELFGATADMQHDNSSKLHAAANSSPGIQQQHQLASPLNLSQTGKRQSPCTPLKVNNPKVVPPGSPDLGLHSTGDDGDASSAEAIASDMDVDIDVINAVATTPEGVEQDQVNDVINDVVAAPEGVEEDQVNE